MHLCPSHAHGIDRQSDRQTDRQTDRAMDNSFWTLWWRWRWFQRSVVLSCFAEMMSKRYCRLFLLVHLSGLNLKKFHTAERPLFSPWVHHHPHSRHWDFPQPRSIFPFTCKMQLQRHSCPLVASPRPRFSTLGCITHQLRRQMEGRKTHKNRASGACMQWPRAAVPTLFLMHHISRHRPTHLSADVGRGWPVLWLWGDQGWSIAVFALKIWGQTF